MTSLLVERHQKNRRQDCWSTGVENACQRLRLFCVAHVAFLLGELDAGAFQLSLYLGDFGGLDVGGGGLGELGERDLPTRGGGSDAPGLLVEIAEMVVDGGVGGGALDGFAKVVFGGLVLAQLEVDPT